MRELTCPPPLLQRLSDLGTNLPLEELFLEGPVQPEDFAVLLAAIARLPHLKRLALYQVRNPKPALFEDLATAAPGLTALTVRLPVRARELATDSVGPCARRLSEEIAKKASSGHSRW